MASQSHRMEDSNQDKEPEQPAKTIETFDIESQAEPTAKKDGIVRHFARPPLAASLIARLRNSLPRISRGGEEYLSCSASFSPALSAFLSASSRGYTPTSQCTSACLTTCYRTLSSALRSGFIFGWHPSTNARTQATITRNTGSGFARSGMGYIWPLRSSS